MKVQAARDSEWSSEGLGMKVDLAISPLPTCRPLSCGSTIVASLTEGSTASLHFDAAVVLVFG